MRKKSNQLLESNLKPNYRDSGIFRSFDFPEYCIYFTLLKSVIRQDFRHKQSNDAASG